MNEVRLMPIALLLIGYLVGSIPFAFLLARGVGGIDVRRVGSGNVGAANVYRATRGSLGLTVAALDITKGVAVVLIAGGLGADIAWRTAAGVAAVLGHVYPVWLKFRGGKGVATACGVFGMLAPAATVLAVGVFVATAWATRYVSLASIVASLLLAPLSYATAAPAAVVEGAALAGLLVVYRHRMNIARLKSGRERRIGQ